MGYYQPNPACGCGRCSTRGLMGPAVLVTLGLLFLMSNVSQWSFERTWPILLIVIGAIKVARYVVADGGHMNPGQFVPGQYPPPPYQGYAAPAQNAAPENPPTSAPVSNAPALGDGGSNEVHNG